MKFLQLLVACFFTTSAIAQFSTLPKPIAYNLFGASIDPVEMVSKDFNNDGTPDVAYCSSTANEIGWYQNLGSGHFTEKQIISTSYSIAKDIESTDLDGDTDNDIILSLDNGKLVWFANNGSGVFGSETIIDIELYSAISIACGDIDNNGTEDIIAGWNTDTIFWYPNNGFGVFGTPVMVAPELNAIQAMTICDLNNDGNLDCAVGTSLDAIAVCINLGGGVFDTPIIVSLNADYPTDIDYADLDGDGDYDLVSSSYLDDKIAWYENYGGGSFSAQNVLTLTADKAKSVTCMDLDSDGDTDIFFTSVQDDKVGFFENDGGGNFSGENLVYHTVNAPSGVLDQDINQDGSIDIVVLSNIAESLSWYENQNDSLIYEHYIPTSARFLRALGKGDLNNDGNVDLCMSASLDKVAWYESNGDQTTSTEKILTTQMDSPYGSACGDMDGDGDLDVVASSGFGGGVRWFENNGSGEFILEHYISNDTSLFLETADLNEDGLTDLLTHTSQHVVWFENLGGGLFSPKIIIGALDAYTKFTLAEDIDSDGDSDVISSEFNNDIVFFYENLGGGNFGPQQIIGTSQSPLMADFADIDLDGKNDLVVIFYGDDKISWFPNNGNGTFGTEEIIVSGINLLQHLSCADINLDGYPDIIANNTSPDENLFWIENLGNGNFGSPQNISAAQYTQNRFIALDMDNDNDQDICFGNLGGYLGWFENYTNSPYQVSGRIFFDLDQNGELDSSDFGLNNFGINSVPSSDYSYTFADGNYFINFSSTPGSYQIAPAPIPHWSIVTDSLSYTILIDSGFSSIDSLNFGLYPDSIFQQIDAHLIGAKARCNQVINYWVNITNQGTTIPYGIVELVLDNATSLSYSPVSPDSIVGNHIYWTYDSLLFFASDLFNVHIQMPDFTSMGDNLVSYVNIYAYDTLGNLNLATTDLLSQILFCSYDPNDKISDPSGITEFGYIPNSTDFIEYTIRFQNTGNDTAQHIVIKDQLDPDLGWTTLVPLASSHSMHTHVDASGEVIFTFNNIMLPDSNSSEINSHGFVKYKISLLPGLPIGTEIINTANIYFDQNPAIITNEAVNTILNCDSILYPVYQAGACQYDTLLFANNTSVLNLNFEWIFPDNDTIQGLNVEWPANNAGTIPVYLKENSGVCNVDTAVQFIVHPQHVLILDTIDFCSGNLINVFGQIVNVGGTYQDTLQTFYGCDSIRVQFVNELTSPLVDLLEFDDDTICQESLEIILDGSPSGGVFSGSGVLLNTFNPSLVVSGPHFIYYEYEDGTNGCSTIDSALIYVANCLGEISSVGETILVHPNPFSENFTIYFDPAVDDIYSIGIHDLLGNKVYFNEGFFGQQLLIDRNGIASGIYILTVVNSNNSRMFSMRLIVE